MIIIRAATIRDAAEIAELSRQLGYYTSDQETMENIVALGHSKHHEVFVAVNKQIAIGWIGIYYNISVTSPPLCEINGLVVHEQFRGKGVGKMLIEQAKLWSINKFSKKMRLRCNVKRTEAILFYQHMGFTQTKAQNIFEIML